MIQKLLEWFVSSPPATTITALAILVTALRVQSNREHKKTLNTILGIGTKVDGVGRQLNGDLLKRIVQIEKKLDIR